MYGVIAPGFLWPFYGAQPALKEDPAQQALTLASFSHHNKTFCSHSLLVLLQSIGELHSCLVQTGFGSSKFGINFGNFLEVSNGCLCPADYDSAPRAQLYKVGTGLLIEPLLY